MTAYRERMRAGAYEPTVSAPKRSTSRKRDADGERLKGFKVAQAKRGRKRDA